MRSEAPSQSEGDRTLEPKLLQVLDGLPLGVTIRDPAAKMLYCNPMASKLFNMSAEQLLGQTPNSVKWRYLNEDGSPFSVDQHPAFQVFKAKAPVHGRGAVISPTQTEPLWISYKAYPIFGDSGELRCVVITFTDLTKERKAGVEFWKKLSDFRILTSLNENRCLSPKDFLNAALEHVLSMSECETGFICQYNQESGTFTPNAWSLELQGAGVDPEAQVRLDGADLRVEAIRQRRPIVTNDPKVQLFSKDGLQELRMHFKNFMAIPIFKDGQIVGLVGLANKAAPFDDKDVFQVTLTMEAIWASLERRLTEIEKELQVMFSLEAQKEQQALQSRQLKETENELRAAHTHLLQSQKMEAIGQLAAGVAHEINTPVQYIGDSLAYMRESFVERSSAYKKLRSLLLERCPDQAAAVEEIEEEADLKYMVAQIPKALDRAMEGLERVATIVRSMKTFAHPDDGRPSAMDLRKNILATIELAKNEYKYVADLELDLEEIPSSCATQAR